MERVEKHPRIYYSRGGITVALRKLKRSRAPSRALASFRDQKKQMLISSEHEWSEMQKKKKCRRTYINLYNMKISYDYEIWMKNEQRDQGRANK